MADTAAARVVDDDVEEFPPKLFHVALRKYKNQLNLEWWRDLFLHAVFLPFLRFSLYVMKIPPPSEIEIEKDGTKRFVWLEGMGIATQQWIADRMCKTRFYRIDKLPVDAVLGEESVYLGQQSWPRSSKPGRYLNKPILPHTSKLVSEQQAEQRGLQGAINQVDRLREKVRATTPV